MSILLFLFCLYVHIELGSKYVICAVFGYAVGSIILGGVKFLYWIKKIYQPFN